ncbi:MAG: hypothetical protein KF730_08280 [Sphingomonas sp.]|uniref:hypothetical protein n=1 Tax=Sphingomonas sp. TaxID=28214 RepID=UPI0025EF3995|nr:hypothetical protein [Sphingomonas sp.]MBX3564557.1 hypothetical protein [Sphingomonas sp.]
MQSEESTFPYFLHIFIRRIATLWLLALFVLPFLIFLFLKATVPTPSIDATFDAKWGTTWFSYTSWVWFATASSALFFGALGSSVSFVSRADPGDVSRRSIFAAQVLGGVFAGMLTLMFVGGLVQGSLFPTFRAARWYELFFDVPSWAKLMVWTFIAGFSERFVPDLLTRLIQQSSNPTKEPGSSE